MYLGSGFYCLACWPLVSNGALAMLLLNVEASQLTTNLAWSFFRVILRCQAKGEPILVPAYLVQLGQHMLASKPSEPVHETLHESAACIKATNRACGPSAILHVGVPIGTSLWITWLKTLFSMFGEGNGFPRPSRPLLRSMLTSLWSICGAWSPSRILSCAALAVVGSWLNPAHWMPRIITWIFKSFGCPRLTKVSFSVCNSALLGLAHVGSRLGLRPRLSDAPELARALKPGSVFLAAGTRSTYELGPLPFGCDRLTVSKLCGQWKWQAGPLSLSLC